MSRRRWSKLNTTTTWKKRQRPEEWGGNFLMTVGWWITNDWHTEILISVSRPRWWYLIICNCYKGVFKYYITLLFFGGGGIPPSHTFSHFFPIEILQTVQWVFSHLCPHFPDPPPRCDMIFQCSLKLIHYLYQYIKNTFFNITIELQLILNGVPHWITQENTNANRQS